ncbi:TetR/AcrR family transcriptional regulator [Idiomarina loihiensis]|mgnify:FL=1|uniref:TetR/AcrR family transcriptional regulator n=2 Tax=Idiomarinaceae TaxID=267893 RepID=UPI00054F6DE0|nr:MULTISPECIES: TetR/AcrR family transcriptional regulator [unclassified Idiomarina]NWO03071.1 TetR/AcrR family transcriptional regulator [Idiomarinaceae bacterium]HAS23669.1 TetR/AcrR family transcriptional regulator [Idiomarina loihiensis]
MTYTARRLTRREQQEQTRVRLIDAANRMFAEVGIIAASLRNLCARAGFSQGAFYSNFTSKDELLLSVIERHIQQEVSLMQELVSKSDSEGIDGALDRLAYRLSELARDPQWSLLSVELQLHSRRDPSFAERSEKVKMASLREFSVLLENLINRHNLAPVMPVFDLARGLYALWSGLALQGSIKEALPRDQVFLSFLRNMIVTPST